MHRLGRVQVAEPIGRVREARQADKVRLARSAGEIHDECKVRSARSAGGARGKDDCYGFQMARLTVMVRKMTSVPR